MIRPGAMHVKQTLALMALLACTMISCRQSPPSASTGSQTEDTASAWVPSFNADSAYDYIAKQVAFGPRVPGTKANIACAEYLETTLRSHIPDVVVQKAVVRAYDNTLLNIRNIIGVFHPERNDRILLCAHWDTRHIADHDPDPAMRTKPILGANDGGSGTGVLLEIARQLAMNDPGIGVDIVLFDAEDYGQPEDAVPQKEDTWCLGSQYWSKNPHKPGYRARFGILLDMVGAKNATFPKEEYSVYYAPAIVSLVWETASRLGYGSWFPDRQGGAVTDDHYYINTILRIPTINIIHQDMSGAKPFFEHWHTVKDDMESIDPLTLEAVGNTVMMVLHQQRKNAS